MIASTDLARLAVAFSLGAVPAGTASIGVGVQGDPLCAGRIDPGHSASAGNLYVTDTGSQAEPVTAGIMPGQPHHRGWLAAPASWVSVTYPKRWWVFAGSSVTLRPHGSAYLPVNVSVPAGARAGVYEGQLQARTAGTPSEGTGVNAAMGAGAATVIVFSVSVPAPVCTAYGVGVPVPARTQPHPAAAVAAPSPAPSPSQQQWRTTLASLTATAKTGSGKAILLAALIVIFLSVGWVLSRRRSA